MPLMTDAQVRERRAARWSRVFASRPVPSGSPPPEREPDPMEHFLSEDSYGLCPGWWIPVMLVVGFVWLAVLAWAISRWA